MCCFDRPRKRKAGTGEGGDGASRRKRLFKIKKEKKKGKREKEKIKEEGKKESERERERERERVRVDYGASREERVEGTQLGAEGKEKKKKNHTQTEKGTPKRSVRARHKGSTTTRRAEAGWQSVAVEGGMNGDNNNSKG